MIFAAKNIVASRVNLMMNDFACGLPSPLSFIGLADAIVRDLGLSPWSGRVIPVLHRVTPSLGRTKPEMEPKGKSFSPIETMEDMIGTVELSLILDIPGCESASTFSEVCMRRRIAGGVIQNHRLDVEVVSAEGTAFCGLRRGYVMLAPNAETPELSLTSTGDDTSFGRILEILFPDERTPGSGWIVPVAAGYYLLEDPDKSPDRIRRRDPSVPHVFAEPVLGLAELVSVRNSRLTNLKRDAFEALFWAWHAEGDILFGHHSYRSNAIQKEEIVYG